MTRRAISARRATHIQRFCRKNYDKNIDKNLDFL